MTYYCAMPGGKVSLDKPSGDPQVVYEIRYGIILQDNGTEGGAFMNRNGYNGTAGILKVTRTDSSPQPKETWNVFGPTDPKGIANGNEEAFRSNSTGDFGIDDTACRPPASVRGTFGGGSEIKNYQKLTEAQQVAFAPAVAAGAAADEDTGAAQPDCNAQASSPISWIICPIIDLMAGFSDFVFKGIVTPLLADVPISTDPNDGGYKAWQQFRILGNIVLVGAMLAVVYAQIKGQ